MTSFLLLLAAKSGMILAAGLLASLLLRRAPAGTRHLMWITVLAGTLVLPLGFLLPARVVPEPMTIRITTIGGMNGTGRSTSMPVRLLGGLWLLGSTLLLGKLGWDTLRGMRLVRESRAWASSDEFRIRISDKLSGPASWSFGAGTILMPKEARHWTGEQFDAAVRHESAHIQRHDSLWLLLAEAVCALYWFQPLVWYASWRLRVEQEHAADDVVLRSGWDGANYARQLLSLLRNSRREPLFAGAASPSMIEQRVKAILHSGQRRSVVTRSMFAAAVAAAIAIALPLSALQAQRTVYKIGDGVSAPRLIHKVEPNYTVEARDAKVEGTVVLSVVIEETGTISDVRVVRGLDTGLDSNAADALRLWQFSPAQKDGVPVAVMANVEVHFRLQ